MTDARANSGQTFEIDLYLCMRMMEEVHTWWPEARLLMYEDEV